MGRNVGADNVQTLVARINELHASAWRVDGRLAGGYQQGAYELRDASGDRAVLKWHRGHLPEPQLHATARVLTDARARGWPTSAWLTYGALPNDGAYVIEEFIEGAQPKSLEPALLDRLLSAADLQADVRPNTPQDWSSYIYRCVFQGEAELAQRMRARAETAALQDRMDALVASARGVALAGEDLVHGDVVLNNVIVRADQPYIVDAAHAGRGTRVYDLATLLVETSVGGDYVVPTPGVHRRLVDACVAAGSREQFLVCAVCRIMHLLVFGGVNWSHSVATAVASCHAFLDRLESL